MPGQYEVKLQVANSRGEKQTISKTVTVLPALDKAEFVSKHGIIDPAGGGAGKEILQYECATGKLQRFQDVKVRWYKNR